MNDLRCSHCGLVGLESGFLSDSGQGSKGYARWMAGRLERGMLGIAKTFRRPWVQVDAFRCSRCGHLELFTPGPAE